MADKGNYQIWHSINEGIHEFIITGSATGSVFEKLIHEVDSILMANDAKEVIFDIRSLEEHIDSSAFYNYAKKQNFFIYRVKTAVVDLQEKTSFAIALKNAGVSVERFPDIDSARRWIKINPIKESWERG